MNYKDAIKFITSKDNFYIDLGLGRVLDVLKKLGNPQDKLKYIHVAGTNGKGSVCAMLDSILQEAGYRTGLYTSPHIWEYTERIKINGVEIPQEKFTKYTEKITETNIHLTEFEILTVIAFLYFCEEKADIVILETGLGGRLDATNVIKENLCSVITHIDLDHTDRLGDTKEKIASEKAGIIKSGCPVITAMKYDAIKNKAENSLIFAVSEDVQKEYINALSLKGSQQKENLALALCVIKHIFPKITEKTIINGLKKVKNPCRFEYIESKNLIVDASHNPNGVEALRKNLDNYYPNQERRFIFGCLNTKDYKNMMETLFRKGDEIYLNEFDYPKACKYEELASACPYKTEKYSDFSIIKPNKLNIICGSFYMIGGMKELKNLIR